MVLAKLELRDQVRRNIIAVARLVPVVGVRVFNKRNQLPLLIVRKNLKEPKLRKLKKWNTKSNDQTTGQKIWGAPKRFL